jgi:hypothetical protein
MLCNTNKNSIYLNLFPNILELRNNLYCNLQLWSMSKVSNMYVSDIS